jgi:hypothetical protein
MNMQTLEKIGRWSFWILLIASIVFCTSALLPVFLAMAFLCAMPGFPGFRQRMKWRRFILFSFATVLIFLAGIFYFQIDSDFFDWAVWPAQEFDEPSTAQLIFWLAVKGCVFGLIIESLVAVGQGLTIEKIASPPTYDWDAEEEGPPWGAAGLACLASLGLVYFASLPFIADPNPQFNEWALPLLFVIVPTSMAYLVLYRGAWRGEWPRRKRVVSMIWRASLIWGFVVMMLVAGILLSIIFTRIIWFA